MSVAILFKRQRLETRALSSVLCREGTWPGWTPSRRGECFGESTVSFFLNRVRPGHNKFLKTVVRAFGIDASEVPYV